MNIDTLVPDSKGGLEWPAFPQDKRAVVAVGNFDGVHLGHAAVLKRTVELAAKHDALAVAILFDPRPEVVQRYAKEHDGAQLPQGEHYADEEALTDVRQRLAIIESFGIERALVIRYTMEFGHRTYLDFIGQLVGKIGMRTLVLGTDARMGRDRAGDVKSISNLAAATGVFELEVVDDRGPGEARVPLNNTPQAAEAIEKVNDPNLKLSRAERRSLSKNTPNRLVRVWSSIYVRFLLSRGHVEQSAQILGRPHSVEGMVVPGKQRGRTLGFPTANVAQDLQGYMPADAVYAGWLIDTDANSGEERRYPSAISIGTKQTFGEPEERVLEAFALIDGQDGVEFTAMTPDSKGWVDLYGHHVRVEFLTYLRPQVHFDSAQTLVDELRCNVEQTRRICAETKA